MKVFAASSCAAALCLAGVLAAAQVASAQHIVVDPGHGGNDPGGVGNGLQEKDIVLDTAFRLRDLIEADTADAGGGGSWVVNMTRDADVRVELAARSDYANSLNADRFMSIHSNAFGDPQANGIETFAFAEGGEGAALRDLVQEEMILAWPLTDRGNKVANFSVLRETAMPAELHELAFITNSGDALYLASASERQKAAEAHLRALQRHFGHAPYIPAGSNLFGSLLVTVISTQGPIAGAQVGIDGSNAGGTGQDGTIQIDDVPVGSHIVDASAPGFVTRDEIVVISADNTTPLNFTLSPVPTAEECAAQPCREGCPDALTPACANNNCALNPCEAGCPEAETGACVPPLDDPGGCGCQSSDSQGLTWLCIIGSGLLFRRRQRRTA